MDHHENILRKQQACIQYSSFLRSRCNTYKESEFYLSRLRIYLETAEQPDPDQILTLEFPAHHADPAPTVVELHSNQTGPRIAVVNGFPSPGTIGLLGHELQVKPELFLGHLEVERILVQDRTSFELPALPSKRDNIVHIRLVRLGRSEMVQSSGEADALLQERGSADISTQQYERALFTERKYGATRFRKVNIHSARYFSTEQLVSFSVTGTTSENWTGLFLLDRGSGLHTESDVPWQRHNTRPRQRPDFLPSVAYNGHGSMAAVSASPLHSIPSGDLIHPFHPLSEVFRQDETEILCRDPFFILGRVYVHAASAWNQMLNFLEDDIAICQKAETDDCAKALGQLRHNSALIQRFQGFMCIDMSTIRDRGGRRWPRVQREDLARQVDGIQSQLLNDYEDLLARCRDLLRRCEASGSILQSQIGIQEAQRSLEEARGVAKLTLLAFFFVPVSLVASAFGMNIKEIERSPPSVWVFLLVSAIVLLLSFLVASQTRRSEIRAMYSAQLQ